jgi:hypothetical protein
MKLHCVELHDLFFLPNIFRVIKSRRMNWLGHVARIGERIGPCKGLVGNPRKIHHMEDLGVYEKTIVKWTLTF